MAKSKNFESREIRTKDGSIRFGHIHNDQVHSSVMMMGSTGGADDLEYITIDESEPRKRWITSRCRGRYQIKSGDDIPKGQPGIYFDANNSDIVIRTGGRIRMQAENIDIIANGPDNQNGVINIHSNESINLYSKNINQTATGALKLYTQGSMELSAENILRMYYDNCQRISSKSSGVVPLLPKPPRIFDTILSILP